MLRPRHPRAALLALALLLPLLIGTAVQPTATLACHGHGVSRSCQFSDYPNEPLVRLEAVTYHRLTWWPYFETFPALYTAAYYYYHYGY